MERKLTKMELKAVRLVLALTLKEMAELLGVSISHLSRTEKDGTKDYSYNVSKKLDSKVKEVMERMEIDLEETLEIARKRGLLK
ncbi:hypothetical protein GLW03_12955 [Halobacillus halophilus]|uniref:hypothetical protein n=1 Tax=Halobacillus halophilus TaxID=1570 RepID=UPI00136DE0B8|nr:hypothetical protein [Halobacillus halophilus]MYL30735.1 hypothetical protein [Halobacillus halophilus]